MDEPTEGLAPLVVQAIQEALYRIKREGVTVVLAEQNIRMALEVGDWHHIIDNGRIRFSGSSQAIRGNEEIKTVYLGVSKRG
jgi:branched-chain amino acid transport system ATP-binding protein